MAPKNNERLYDENFVEYQEESEERNRNWLRMRRGKMSEDLPHNQMRKVASRMGGWNENQISVAE